MTTMTRKGQVTIPKEVRNALGLRPFDNVEFELNDGQAVLRRVALSLDDLEGILPSCALPFDRIFEVAKEERAAWVMREMG